MLSITLYVMVNFVLIFCSGFWQKQKQKLYMNVIYTLTYFLIYIFFLSYVPCLEFLKLKNLTVHLLLYKLYKYISDGWELEKTVKKKIKILHKPRS